MSSPPNDERKRLLTAFPSDLLGDFFGRSAILELPSYELPVPEPTETVLWEHSWSLPECLSSQPIPRLEVPTSSYQTLELSVPGSRSQVPRLDVCDSAYTSPLSPIESAPSGSAKRQRHGHMVVSNEPDAWFTESTDSGFYESTIQPKYYWDTEDLLYGGLPLQTYGHVARTPLTFGAEFGQALLGHSGIRRSIVYSLTRQPRAKVQAEVRECLANFAKALNVGSGWPTEADVLTPLLYSADEVSRYLCTRALLDASQSTGLRASPRSPRRLPKPKMTLHDLSCIDSFRRNLPSLEKSLAHSDNKGVRRVREQLMDLYPKVVNGQKAKYQAEVAVEWDLRGFMSSQFGSRLPAVASIVVLSGTVASAQASTCSNYLRDTWPTTGKYFVQLLEDVALKRKMPVNRDFKDSEDPNISDPSQKQLGGPEDETHDGPLTVKICVGPDSYSYCIMPRLRTRRNCASGIRLFIEADELSKVAEITEQLAWSACALSTSPFGDELAYTVFNLRKQRDAKNDAPLLEGSIEHIPLPDSESSCWIPLFNGACIARDFPVAVRCAKVEDDQRGPHAGEPRPEVEFEDEGYEEEPAMRGLEIPLHLLAEIGGVRHVVEYGGGLVMKGFSHMFIPIRGKKNLVQWHAVSSTDPDVRLTYEDALRQCSTRATLKEVSLKDLETTRAILGWCSVATSRLGSSHADYENIDYSGSEEATSRFRLAGGQLGFQQFGVAALDFRLGAKDGKCHFRRAGTYDRVVSAAEKTPVVLYDTCALRSWLVNASDVILHMIQHRHQSRPYKTHQGQIELCTQIKTGSSARQVLLANQDICLGDEDEQTFKNEVFTLWSLLELLIDQNVSRERNAQGVRVKTDLREHLVGFEYRAVVDDRSPFRLMTTDLLKSHGGWPSLIRDIDALVLLANGFGELILPSDQDRGAMCSAWHRVPEGRDYMATSTTSLKDMYDVAGCRVDRKYLTSSKLQWHQGESLLFDACSDKQNCKCDRLQQIMSSTAMGKTVQPQHMAEHGAVIFGQPKSLPRGLRKKFRAESHEASSLYLQPNEPLTKTQSPSVTIVIPPKDIDNATTPDSAYQSASDSSFGSTPNSLSSWVPPSAQEGLLPTIREAPPSKYKCILSAEDEVKEIVKGKKRMWTPPKTPVMEFEPQRSLRRVEAFVMQPKRSRRL